MNWIALALLCAFALASADVATKAWLQGFSAPELLVVRFGIPGLLMTPLLLGLPSLTDLPLAFWGWIALLIPLELAAMLLYMAAIRDHPLSLTLPYLAFTPVFVIGVAWLVLGERVSARGAAGVLLVVAGAWLLNSAHARASDWRSWAAPFAAILDEPGSRMMLAVAAIYAITATLGKGAMRYLPPESFGAFYFALLGLAVFVLFVLPRPRVLLKLASHFWRVLGVGALMSLMVYTHFLAIQEVAVAYMIAVKRLSLLIGILYGALLFQETGLAARLPAGALMLAGVMLILV
ncbi:DMT family transporter [Thiocystis violascens]|uniref:Putative membrane protein n=1 Tax=Thiocystis violascens (strain ATCC 17096 / DSM 198 / 6111) TaxID=765911 RepID=I3Y9Y2_THIV6|nr:DMT family transporter [Thiocystis violascens]AFL73800.1 putative membrane protein [Thiocystis violascens DSM 198]